MSTAERSSTAFGIQLKSARHARGMTQEELANRTDMHASNVGRMERGEANPSLSTMARLAAALGIDLGQLLSGIPAANCDECSANSG